MMHVWKERELPQTCSRREPQEAPPSVSSKKSLECPRLTS